MHRVALRFRSGTWLWTGSDVANKSEDKHTTHAPIVRSRAAFTWRALAEDIGRAMQAWIAPKVWQHCFRWVSKQIVQELHLECRAQE